MLSLVMLAVFSGFSLNLLLQFALGAAGVAGETAISPVNKTGGKRRFPVVQTSILFFSSLFLWVFFIFIVPDFWKGFVEFFLFIPLSALLCMGLELLAKKILSKTHPSNGDMEKVYSAFTAYEGLVPASLIITFLLANNFASAMVLSLFFAIGNLVALLILDEIRHRSTMEWVPHYLRGSPLILISMGLLSLISVSVAGICFRMLGFF